MRSDCTMDNKKMLEDILSEFEELTQIPRKSGHEKEISDYLYKKAQALGLQVVQDEVNNLIIEKPASKGYENVPVTIIQGHMDMVCVGKHDYNPLIDKIVTRRDGDFLAAVGTSLGADDGFGVATAFYILKNDFEHGPLRVILTVDEEAGMSGAKALDKKYLDAGYLINCDSEDYDVVTIASAGGVNIDLEKTPEWVQPQNHAAYRVAIKGLVGGHSGAEIHKHRANAIRILSLALEFMREAGITLELAAINGGTAMNVIPSSAEAIVVIRDVDIYRINNVITKINAYMEQNYHDVEKNYYIEFAPCKKPEQVLSDVDCTAVLDMLCLVKNGVLRDAEINGKRQVITSSNVGIVKLEQDKVALRMYPRSSNETDLQGFKINVECIARLCGFKAICSHKAPAWPAKTDGKLAGIAADVFEQQTGKPMSIEAIHAGLECSWFFEKNPQLEMISVGPTILDIHSVDEKIQLSTVVPHINMILGVLKTLKDQ